jgi:hypothetical protein
VRGGGAGPLTGRRGFAGGQGRSVRGVVAGADGHGAEEEGIDGGECGREAAVASESVKTGEAHFFSCVPMFLKVEGVAADDGGASFFYSVSMAAN